MGYDDGVDIALDSQNNIFVVGSTTSYGNGSSDILLVKYDKLGNQIWNRTIGTENSDKGASIVIDNMDNILICGGINSNHTDYSSGDVFIAKLNNNGIQIWNFTWGTNEKDMSTSIALDSSENIYITGVAGATSLREGGDLLLLKLNSSGYIQWNKSYGDLRVNYHESGNGIAIDSTDNIYIAGGIHHWAPFIMQSRDYVFLGKFNGSGVQLWNSTWGGGSFVYNNGYNIALDSLDNAYVIGTTTLNYDDSRQDLLLLKYNNLGTLLWSKLWGGGSYDLGIDIKLDSSGDIYSIGMTDSFGAKKENFVLVKFDNSGEELYYKTWGGDNEDWGYGVCLDNENNVYCTGYTNSSNIVESCMAIVKFSNDTDNDGLSDWLEINVYFTNPNDHDDDNDGLLDGDEVYDYLTDPKNDDTDGDNLLDGLEIYTYKTNPNREDTDEDGLSDWSEITIYFTDANNKDTDFDRLIDGDEINYYSTNPHSKDTDGDGFSDYDEIFIHRTDPTNVFHNPLLPGILIPILVASFVTSATLLVLRRIKKRRIGLN